MSAKKLMSAKKFKKYLRNQRAGVFEFIADIIEDDPEWIAHPDINDEDISDGLRIAAKLIREGQGDHLIDDAS